MASPMAGEASFISASQTRALGLAGAGGATGAAMVMAGAGTGAGAGSGWISVGAGIAGIAFGFKPGGTGGRGGGAACAKAEVARETPARRPTSTMTQWMVFIESLRVKLAREGLSDE